MKKILIIIFMCFLFSCSDGLLENKSYNNFQITLDFEKDFIEELDNFYVAKTEEKDEQDENGLKRIITYQFKSKKPYRVDEEGNWYYHWCLVIEKYDSYQSAVHNFNNSVKKIKELYEIDPILLKGRNNRAVIIDDAIYILKAGCQEGRHVEEWFKKMLFVLLQDNNPQENTILETYGGGSFGIR